MLLRDHLHHVAAWIGETYQTGGSWLVAAISGGTVWPSMTGAVVTARNAHVAMLIPMTGYIVGMVFPIYVNVYQRERMDTHRATEVGLVQPTEKELELERNESSSKPQAVEICEDDLKSSSNFFVWLWL
jgi:FHS family L-fucose permease-like MFS transporter